MNYDDIVNSFVHIAPEQQSIVAANAKKITDNYPWFPKSAPQMAAYFSEADELFYGGEAGGGKTDLLLGLALTAHKRSLILRRINKDAAKLANRIETILEDRRGYNGQAQSWRYRDPFGTERRIDLGGCELESDKHRYKGEPHDLIGVDEGSDFLYSQIRFMLAWLRTEDPNQRCRLVVASNPPMAASGRWVIKHWAPWLDKNHPNPAKDGELRWYVSGEGDEDVEVDGVGPHLVRGRMIRAQSRTFIRANVQDNTFLSRDEKYITRLESLTGLERRAYRDGDFTIGERDDDYQAIPTAWIDAAQQRWTEKPPPNRGMTAMAVDVAPGGGDQRVICYRYGGWFGPFDAKREIDKTGRSTAAAVVNLRHNRCPVIVDMGGGWGGDALLALKDNGIDDVVSFNGVALTTEKTRDGKLGFRNKRAAAVWRFREALDPTQEGGSVVALPPDSELRADLASYRFEHTVGGILIGDKDKIKDLIGRSPDKGDAAIMCLAEGERAVWRAMHRQGRQRQERANVGFQNIKEMRL